MFSKHPVLVAALIVLTTTSRITQACSKVRINEINSNEPSTDTADFVELFDGGSGGTDLTGLVLIYFNGANNEVYMSVDLSGYQTDASGIFTVGMPATNPDIVDGQNIQNGPDGIGLYCNPETPYQLTNANLMDAVVYASKTTGQSDGLLDALVPGQQMVRETAGTPDTSGCRCLCSSVLTQNCFTQCPPTPGVYNSCGGNVPTKAPTTTTVAAGQTTIPPNTDGTTASASSAAPTTHSSNSCTTGWTAFKDPIFEKLTHCYKLITTAVPVTEASSVCVKSASVLVTVHSGQEQTFLEELTATAKQVWLGARRGSDGTSTFVWTDGSAMDYQNWAAGQPSGSGDCVAMDSTGKWSQIECYTSAVFICKK